MEEKKECFVIMPFAETFDDIYFGIQKALEKSNYKCTRADKIKGFGNVIRHIVESTNEADVVIVDLTGNNPNVFYELGLAHGLRKHVIMLTQDIDQVPFDLKNYRIIEYSQGRSFREFDKFENDIITSLDTLDANNEKPTNPVHDFLSFEGAHS